MAQNRFYPPGGHIVGNAAGYPFPFAQLVFTGAQGLKYLLVKGRKTLLAWF